MSKGYSLDIYFGVPGAGKTTCAAWLARKAIKAKRLVYSNVPITGAYHLNAKEDIGKYMLKDALIIIDEAGIEYNNRKFKDLSEEAIYFYKYHRHYQCDVVVFSQSYDDMDITLRRLAQHYFFLKKSLIPYFICRRRIGKKVGINETTREIMDEYFFQPFGIWWIFSPPLWRYFNTYSHKVLPSKKWEFW